uniref:Uncharacterized protein n=1 Tax=Molossus molossus TaxID=27622 RepID=A0A7J8FS18_MOLMO|nr:hypothetical protein HJG59_008411 [Molossus molossus]
MGQQIKALKMLDLFLKVVEQKKKVQSCRCSCSECHLKDLPQRQKTKKSCQKKNRKPSQQYMSMLWWKKLLESKFFCDMFSPTTSNKISFFRRRPKSVIIIIDFSSLPQV